MENSIIIPMFTIIIVILITLCFYMHDSVMIKNAALKLCIRQEFEDTELKILIDKGEEYIKEKSLCAGEIFVNIKDVSGKYICYAEAVFFSKLSVFGKKRDMIKKAEVEKNKPAEFIRMINAADEFSQIFNKK